MNEVKIKDLPPYMASGTIYQMFLRAFSARGTLRAAGVMLPHIASLGVKIVYLCPVAAADDDERREFWSARQRECRLDNPCNPYRIKDYFAIDPEYGTADDLVWFVEEAHRLGLRVILDLVYYHCGPAAVFIAEHPDFVKRDAAGNVCNGGWFFPELNFASEELREYLYTNMEYLVRTFDVDGFRCDVSCAVPLDFWEAARKRIDHLKPELFMLAESDGCVEEQQTAFEASYCWEFMARSMPSFLRGEINAADLRERMEAMAGKLQGARILRAFDSHDIAHDTAQRRVEAICENGRTDAALVFIFALDGVPFIYNGQEVGDGNPHSIFANRTHSRNFIVDWGAALTGRGRARLELMKKIIALRNENLPLGVGSFTWLNNDAPEDCLSFVRCYGDKEVTAIFNFGDKPRQVRVSRRLPDGAGEILLVNGVIVKGNGGDGIFADMAAYGYILLETTKKGK